MPRRGPPRLLKAQQNRIKSRWNLRSLLAHRGLPYSLTECVGKENLWLECRNTSACFSDPQRGKWLHVLLLCKVHYFFPGGGGPAYLCGALGRGFLLQFLLPFVDHLLLFCFYLIFILFFLFKATLLFLFFFFHFLFVNVVLSIPSFIIIFFEEPSFGVQYSNFCNIYSSPVAGWWWVLMNN